MKKYRESGNIVQSAEHSGISSKTARKYIREGFPQESVRQNRDWRTRTDPFAEIWTEVEVRLEAMRSGQYKWVTAKELFDELILRYPTQLSVSTLRSFQRRVSHWKSTHACDDVAEVYFEQVHVPGRLLELDWFHSQGQMSQSRTPTIPLYKLLKNYECP